MDNHLQGDVHAAQEVVLTSRSGALRDLLEESSEPFHTSHFIEFNYRVEHRGLVVVVPEINIADSKASPDRGLSL